MKILIATILFFSSFLSAEEKTEFELLSVDSLMCIGTEPFWSLDVEQDKATFEDLDENKVFFQVDKVIQSLNHTNRWFVTLKSKATDRPNFMTVHRTGECSDDMSDNQYEFEMMLLTEDSISYSGCCNKLD
ncbi:hypothetical protein VIBNISFn27_960001 [Vibrio nigripulchritudo SFn27]|uniref:Uncharacterized protein n=2 Tax=Vibrio nigripulchritudo TaxID=28173 RepID=U4KDV8_9VIBR|nr:hypothetical protein [Vibrio nigripulchritudo]CCN84397.1 hypothetical protein VIBNIBLFn1_730007 [Vibrio nigripulchritudo BLFn1]CCN91541.1 hypothetical protein VIBNISFn27_960001 [Vibrio nigripulchritudo SFn27]CCN93425.1 hypothetical protein VIBNIENn2_220008 [Vibrio nigripulchritudo ENn2]CCO42095.1 hypothetical protein VIBNISFn135_710007 [Vibrio nigripulchritudo SFn135]CCO48611.1 hypothetical protein VIBNISOn1_570001 [Vibrio nigripulchritudo SOn1]